VPYVLVFLEYIRSAILSKEVRSNVEDSRECANKLYLKNQKVQEYDKIFSRTRRIIT